MRGPSACFSIVAQVLSHNTAGESWFWCCLLLFSCPRTPEQRRASTHANREHILPSRAPTHARTHALTHHFLDLGEDLGAGGRERESARERAREREREREREESSRFHTHT